MDTFIRADVAHTNDQTNRLPVEGIGPSIRAYESLVIPFNYTGAVPIYYINLLFTKNLVDYDDFFLKARPNVPFGTGGLEANG